MKTESKIIYPLSNPIVFAMVMRNKRNYKKLLEMVLPERKIRELN